MKGLTGPDGKFVPDKPPTFDFDSNAYRSWERSGGFRWPGCRHVLDPYNNAYANIT